MKTKRVLWIRSGFEIPGVGVTKEDEKSKPIPIAQAEEFIKRGLAKDIVIEAPKSDIKKGDKA